MQINTYYDPMEKFSKLKLYNKIQILNFLEIKEKISYIFINKKYTDQLFPQYTRKSISLFRDIYNKKFYENKIPLRKIFQIYYENSCTNILPLDIFSAIFLYVKSLNERYTEITIDFPILIEKEAYWPIEKNIKRKFELKNLNKKKFLEKNVDKKFDDFHENRYNRKEKYLDVNYIFADIINRKKTILNIIDNSAIDKYLNNKDNLFRINLFYSSASSINNNNNNNNNIIINDIINNPEIEHYNNLENINIFPKFTDCIYENISIKQDLFDFPQNAYFNKFKNRIKNIKLQINPENVKLITDYINLNNLNQIPNNNEEYIQKKEKAERILRFFELDNFISNNISSISNIELSVKYNLIDHDSLMFLLFKFYNFFKSLSLNTNLVMNENLKLKVLSKEYNKFLYFDLDDLKLFPLEEIKLFQIPSGLSSYYIFSDICVFEIINKHYNHINFNNDNDTENLMELEIQEKLKFLKKANKIKKIRIIDKPDSFDLINKIYNDKENNIDNNYNNCINEKNKNCFIFKLLKIIENLDNCKIDKLSLIFNYNIINKENLFFMKKILQNKKIFKFLELNFFRKYIIKINFEYDFTNGNIKIIKLRLILNEYPGHFLLDFIEILKNLDEKICENLIELELEGKIYIAKNKLKYNDNNNINDNDKEINKIYLKNLNFIKIRDLYTKDFLFHLSHLETPNLISIFFDNPNKTFFEYEFNLKDFSIDNDNDNNNNNKSNKENSICIERYYLKYLSDLKSFRFILINTKYEDVVFYVHEYFYAYSNPLSSYVSSNMININREKIFNLSLDFYVICNNYVDF
jgi:hypothetical protein